MSTPGSDQMQLHNLIVDQMNMIFWFPSETMKDRRCGQSQQSLLDRRRQVAALSS
jgi:hypothetical protein